MTSEAQGHLSNSVIQSQKGHVFELEEDKRQLLEVQNSDDWCELLRMRLP